MFEKIESRVDFVKKEHDILSYWEKENIFDKLVKKIGIFYSFNTHKSGKVAERIREAFGDTAEV